MKLTKPYWNALDQCLAWLERDALIDAHELHALVPIAQVLVDQVRHLAGDADPTAERRLHAISDAYQNQQAETLILEEIMARADLGQHYRQSVLSQLALP